MVPKKVKREEAIGHAVGLRSFYDESEDRVLAMANKGVCTIEYFGPYNLRTQIEFILPFDKKLERWFKGP